MPKITEKEFKDRLYRGEKFLYTIDTSIFCSNHFRFEGDQLSGFCVGYKNARFVLPKIIYDEALNKYIELLTEEHKKATEALKSFPDAKCIKDCLNHLNALNIKTECTTIFDNFLINKKTTIISNDIDINSILDSYFSSTIPFRNTKNKKNEFPDAIALNSLERYAIKNNSTLIIISTDNDWIDYCKASSSVFYIEYKKELLKEITFLFKQLNANDNAIAKTFKQYLSSSKCKYDLSTIENAIATFFEDTSTIECDAISSFALDMDIEIESISVDHINYDGSKWAIEDKKPDSITLIGLIPIEITCTASIDFSKWDSEDQEKYGISCTSKEQTESLLIEVRANLSTEDLGDLATATIDDCTVTSQKFYIDLGEVDPFEDEE